MVGWAIQYTWRVITNVMVVWEWKRFLFQHQAVAVGFRSQSQSSEHEVLLRCLGQLVLLLLSCLGRNGFNCVVIITGSVVNAIDIHNLANVIENEGQWFDGSERWISMSFFWWCWSGIPLYQMDLFHAFWGWPWWNTFFTLCQSWGQVLPDIVSQNINVPQWWWTDQLQV